MIERLALTEAPEFEGLDREVRARQFASRLSIRPVRVSAGSTSYDVRVIDVSFTAGDPKAAMNVANAVCEAFIERERAQCIASADEAIAFLRGRRGEAVAALAKAEEALRQWESQMASDQTAEKVAATSRGQVPPEAVMRKDVEAKRQLVDSLTSRMAEEYVSQGPGETTSQIVSRAVPPKHSPSARRGRSLGDGLAMGVIIAIALVAAFELLDWRVWDAGHVQQYLGLPVVGRVTLEKRNLAAGSASILVDESESEIAEDFRRIRAKLLLAPQAVEWRSLAVVSTRGGEGCSTVVANLAVAIAGWGKRVLLVDADLEHPALHGALGLEAAAGLAGLLGAEVGQEEVVQETAIENLFVVPSGASLPYPSELLGGETMSQFAKWATESYDMVLYDTRPLSAASDGLVVASRCDAALFVVREGSTNRLVARRCVGELDALGVRTVGAVLNGSGSWCGGWL